MPQTVIFFSVQFRCINLTFFHKLHNPLSFYEKLYILDRKKEGKMDKFILKGHEFGSRLLTGTGKFSDKNLVAPMLEASGSQIITMALRRINFQNPKENILNYIPKHITLLPNTSGARTAEEAVKIARIAREAGCGDFIKIEIINDSQYLMPDNSETIKATKILADEGFIVLPYMMPDLIAAKRMEDAGAAAVMPLGSPIGSNRGIVTKPLIEMMLETNRPSDAAIAMEMGCDAVLVNTAIATAQDPVKMGRAFSLAVEAGREAFLAKIAEEKRYASASSPLTGFLFRGDK